MRHPKAAARRLAAHLKGLTGHYASAPLGIQFFLDEGKVMLAAHKRFQVAGEVPIPKGKTALDLTAGDVAELVENATRLLRNGLVEFVNALGAFCPLCSGELEDALIQAPGAARNGLKMKCSKCGWTPPLPKIGGPGHGGG